MKKTRKPYTVKTLPQVARYFKVSISTVNRWSAEGMPSTPGAYSIPKICKWLFCFGPWACEQARDDYLRAADE